ncbi:uncharacterized protein UTRI_04139 [Ustilago trichophora]|uniref:Tc1-like transposase DDE domain-containing protein n=1 Tax=Ustilago trichophora TaxID=86804 RepID=A0A5C3E8V5_9BASI|nr:uncharacterized protein UTRI_04139 [Ustilago trichophora]
MPAPLSKDMQARIVHAVHELNLSYGQAARQLQTSPATVRCIYTQWRDTGSAAPQQMGGNCLPMIGQPQLDFLEAQLDQSNTSVTLETLQICMGTQFGTTYSITSIWRAVTQKLQYRLKRTHLMPQDYNSNARIIEHQAWCTQFLQEGLTMMDCIYVDKSGFNLHQIHTVKYARKGQRAIQVRPSRKGKNTSLVIAAAKEGMVAYDFKQGAYNGASFAAFIAEKLLPAMQCMGMRNKVIIMDNCRIHYNAGVRGPIEAAGHQLCFLPPYSPFLNAAEWVFAHVKPQMRKDRFNTWEYMVMCMQAELNQITERHISGWIREVCRNAADAILGRALGLTYHADGST